MGIITSRRGFLGTMSAAAVAQPVAARAQLPTPIRRIRVVHRTDYYYSQPVTFGMHRVMMRPREGYDIHIATGRFDIQPTAKIRWLRDIYSNSIAILTFSDPADKLTIMGEADVDYLRDSPVESLIDPDARFFPFQYSPEEQIELIAYRLPSYPYDGRQLYEWLQKVYSAGQSIETYDLLMDLNAYIYHSFKYARREEFGVQGPGDTLKLGSGSCRDFAVLMMEAARHWGFGARFVTGYVQIGEGKVGATHAWTEIYLPGAGWQGFDPTNNKRVGSEYISVAVAREQEKACPISGVWNGPADAFKRMDVSVEMFSL